MPKGGHTHTDFSGSAETFQTDHVGTFTYSSFPIGWSDLGQANTGFTSPQPSAVVVNTTDASGHTTRALAILPVVAESQGIYRPVGTSDFYKTTADVRIDRFGDVDDTGRVEDPNKPGFLICGCPVEFRNITDTAAQVSFINLDGSADPLHSAFFGVIGSSDTETWRIDAGTANIIADVDTGVKIQLGKWYGIETDLDASSGALHATITDKTLGTTLYDNTIFLKGYGNYQPSVDGVFNTEAYLDSEESLLFGTDPTKNTPDLVMFDNIDAISQHSNNNHGYASHDHGHDNAQWLNTIICNNG